MVVLSNTALQDNAVLLLVDLAKLLTRARLGQSLRQRLR